MKRFIVAGVVGVLAVVGVTGCQPPPPDYRPPILDSVTQVSPQPAHPGEDVTFAIAVHDDAYLSHAVARELTTPTGSRLPGPRTCTSSLELSGGLAQGVVTVTCPVPTFASNGTWSTEVTVYDRPPVSSPEQSFPGTTRRLSFEVAGGSEDHSSPRLVSYGTDPAVVGQETPFTLTLRVRDDTPPVALTYASVYNFYKPFSSFLSVLTCTAPVATPVSATDTDISLACAPGSFGGRAEVGVHRSVLPVTDALGQTSNIEVLVDVQPQAPGGTP